jgi:hypothetical protein
VILRTTTTTNTTRQPATAAVGYLGSGSVAAHFFFLVEFSFRMLTVDIEDASTKVLFRLEHISIFLLLCDDVANGDK